MSVPSPALPDPVRHPLYGLIVAGGAGTRLWPLSRASHPKQLLSLGPSKNSLLQDTFLRLGRTVSVSRIYTVTGDIHAQSVLQQLHAVAPGFDASTVLSEPQGRGSAAAILWGALHIARQAPQALVAVVWADHLIRNGPVFDQNLIRAAQAAALGELVAIGVTPTRPETGFGYIESGEPSGEGVYRVRRFIEKPDQARAERFIAEGGFCWNAGLFVFPVDTLLQEFRRHAPSVLESFERYPPPPVPTAGASTEQMRMRTIYQDVPEGAIDTLVLEKTDRLQVIPCALDWSDLGSWDVVYETAEKDPEGNTTRGNTVTLNTRNSLVLGQRRLVATIGVENLVVVDTEDAVLVCDLRQAQEVKLLVNLLRQQGHPEADEGRTTHRPWGSYTVIEQGPGFQIKLIEVHAGEALSLQLHQQRDEHWVVMNGTAEVVLGETTRQMEENDHVFIPRGQKHRLGNPGRGPLRILELQRGDYLGEDDIVRFEDRYGRV